MAGAAGAAVMLEVDGVQISRADLIRKYHAEGKTRSEIVKLLKENHSHETTYQIVHQVVSKANKGSDEGGEGTTGGNTGGGRARIMLPNGMSRTDYIRQEYATGTRTRGDIAKELGCTYQIVFAATKGMDGAKAPRGVGKPAQAESEAPAGDAVAEATAEAEGETQEQEPSDESLFPSAE